MLRGVSLSLEAGGALAVLGPSGAGKSTLLGALLGLFPMDEGEVRLEGGPWSSLSERARLPLRDRIQGLLQQPHRALPPHRTGWEILEQPLRARGATSAEARRGAEAAARAAAFPWEALTRRPAAWSGGMAQRLALARALVFRPRVLVLDEPFTGLDPLLACALEGVLQGLRSQGTTLVVATHGLPGAARLCGAALWLAGGRVAGQGPLSAPQDKGPRPGALEAGLAEGRSPTR